MRWSWFIAAVLTSVVLSVAAVYVIFHTTAGVTCTATVTMNGKTIPNPVTC